MVYAFKSSTPSATYMRQWIWAALVYIMACHLAIIQTTAGFLLIAEQVTTNKILFPTILNYEWKATIS